MKKRMSRQRESQCALLRLLSFSRGALAQIGIGISVSFAPPALPVYEQPLCPADGYLWTPGYWAYDDDNGYYWVPGTWVEVPQVGFLWTPGYWGWGVTHLFSMKDIGVRRWGSMAASITDSTTVVMGIREVVGKATTSLTTLM